MQEVTGSDIEYELFNYFDQKSRHSMRVIIGQFVSHDIRWFSNDGKLLNVEEVNSLSRIRLAEEFLKKRTYNGKYKIDSKYNVLKPYDEFELINDIAQFIDLRIPKNYWLRLREQDKGYKDRTIVSKLYPGIDSVEGLEFFYEENYQLETEALSQATFYR